MLQEIRRELVPEFSVKLVIVCLSKREESASAVPLVLSLDDACENDVNVLVRCLRRVGDLVRELRETGILEHVPEPVAHAC